MPAENVVQKAGRIEYIEPNSIFVNSPGDKVQNGIPQPYEDYSFSVNLRVINGDRFGCGMTTDEDDIAKNTLEYSSDNGTISFMDGTSMPGQQGYLTTNFTDISMNDPDTNTRECLGIESISVKYDSWYYPTVTIKFIDVRGASLMQPAEYEYYNNGGPNIGKNTTTSNSDFFKAFFSFPYPLFKLSIKGFYGKQLTYDLSVLKCNIEFNSSTGNFEVSADFIGYMYGMYSDLPFPFVYLAPYINLYGKNTWDEKKRTGDFCYITTDSKNPKGIPMYTFPELKREVESSSERADKIIGEQDEGKKKIDLDNLISKLETSVHVNFPSSTKNFNWWSWSKTDTGNTRPGYFFVVAEDNNENNRKIFEDFYKFQKYVHEYNELVANTKTDDFKDQGLKIMDFFEGIYNDANEAKKRKGSKTSGAEVATVSSDFTDEEIKKFLDGRVVTLYFHREDKKEDPQLFFDEKDSNFGSSDKSKFNELIEELMTRYKNNEINSPMNKNTGIQKWVFKAFWFDNIKYKSSITNTLNHLKGELDKLLKIIAKLREEKIDDLIGFKPTMKNLYNMIFAHVDTFMSCFYNTLSQIRKKIQSNSDQTRKYETLCGGSTIQVDVNKNSLASDSPNGGKLPPFTMFYKEETEKDSEDRKMTMIWPGSLNGGKELDEVKLVEAIINATSLKRREDPTVTPKDNVIGKEGSLVPINYYDIMMGEWNPYLDILNEKTLSDEETVNEVVKVFALRCYYSMLFGSYVGASEGQPADSSSSDITNFTKKAKLVAELEVGNVERAFEMLGMNPTRSFITGLQKLSNDGTSLLNGFKQFTLSNENRLADGKDGNKSIFSSDGGLGSVYYKWIKKSNYYCLPIGTFNPSVLANYVNGANLEKNYDKFLKITPDGAVANTRVNSFCCNVYQGGKKLEKILSKYGTGDYERASKLFPNYNSVPKSIENVSPVDIGTQSYPVIPSYRKSDAGIASIFMDPLYYAQKDTPTALGTAKAIEARAYLFLMGIPFNKEKSYLLPEKVENGDYPSLLLLREGAFYWRNEYIVTLGDPGDPPIVQLENDPITYEYTINGVTKNVLADIEKNDPCLGERLTIDYYKKQQLNSSEGRKDTLIRYFLKWANGVDTNPPGSVFAEAKVDRQIPLTIPSFPTIESYLALWEQNGTTKQILSPASCISAVTIPTVSPFANAGTLREVYEVGPDDNLGKITGNIRTDVKLRNHPKSDVASTDTMLFLNNLRKIFTGRDSIIDFSCFDNRGTSAVVPSNAMTDALSAFVKGLKDTYKVSAEKLKESEGVDTSGKAEDKDESVNYYEGDDLKLACYIALKGMYDRWLCNRRRECWYFSRDPKRMVNNGIHSDFTRFFYIDEFYHNIGMQIRPNLSDFVKMVNIQGGFTDGTTLSSLAAKSIMSILSTTADYGNCALLTLPTMLGLARTYTGEDERYSIEQVFKAYPYNDSATGGGLETSFVVLYSNEKSSKLDVPDDSGKMAYVTDGFDIANTWGQIVPQAMFSDGDENSFVVPSFGVTFAKQNQSFFKDVRLSMDNHQITEYSIRNEVAISYQNNQGPRETTVIGQDLYSVYSNYSYSCDVTMMGDAQITPLMYFQLNNIAMWKGAYMIINVHHDITAHGMETSFKGVRQARPSIPFKDDKLDIPEKDRQEKVPEEPDTPNPAQEEEEMMSYSPRPLDNIDVENVESIIFIVDRTSLTTSSKWINGLFSVRVYYKDGKREDFDSMALTIEATKGLKGRIENFTPDRNEVYFSIPAGRYAKVFIEDAPTGEEYRSPKDKFYSFTGGKHITVNDSRLGFNRCEIITGETDYKLFESGGFKDVSFGGTSPIMLYGNDASDINKQFDKDEIRGVYREVFSLVKRMNEAKKPLTFLVNEIEDLKNTKTDEVVDEILDITD